MKKLQILGTGCPKCKMLAELTDKAAKEMGIAYEIEKVTKINDIMKFGVMTHPRSGSRWPGKACRQSGHSGRDKNVAFVRENMKINTCSETR